MSRNVLRTFSREERIFVHVKLGLDSFKEPKVLKHKKWKQITSAFNTKLSLAEFKNQDPYSQ